MAPGEHEFDPPALSDGWFLLHFTDGKSGSGLSLLNSKASVSEQIATMSLLGNSLHLLKNSPA